MKTLSALVLSGLLLTAAVSAAPKQPNKTGQAKAQTQVKGGDGVFGGIYTMKDGFNLQLRSARYTLEPHLDYAGSMPNEEEKLLVITYAFKNSRSRDNDTGGYNISAFDENENRYDTYSGGTRLASNGSREFSINLKPGQGVGQDAANPLTTCIKVPAKAKIKKIIVNCGREAVGGEEVLRFPIGGATKIQPLPSYAADPADPTGATALSPAPVKLKEYYPNGYFALRLDAVAAAPDEVLGAQKAADGKVFVVATFTAKNVFSKKIGPFYIDAGQFSTMVLRDGDNEKYKLVPDSGLRRAKQDEALPGDELEIGEEITLRCFFEVPKSAKLKSLTYGGGTPGHIYQVQLP